jgi:hypothetical protein
MMYSPRFNAAQGGTWRGGEGMTHIELEGHLIVPSSIFHFKAEETV